MNDSGHEEFHDLPFAPDVGEVSIESFFNSQRVKRQWVARQVKQTLEGVGKRFGLHTERGWQSFHSLPGEETTIYTFADFTHVSQYLSRYRLIVNELSRDYRSHEEVLGYSELVLSARLGRARAMRHEARRSLSHKSWQGYLGSCALLRYKDDTCSVYRGADNQLMMAPKANEAMSDVETQNTIEILGHTLPILKALSEVTHHPGMTGDIGGWRAE